MISVKNLSFSYGDKVVFDNFCAGFSSGISCITGPSGRGKTTLLRIIGGLEKNFQGEVKCPYSKIGYVFQEDRLLPKISAAENVLAVMSERDIKKAVNWLEKLGLEEADTMALPGNLSGGQQRRIAIARCLAYEPDLILLDEPFKGLDPALAEKVAKVIKETGVPTIAVLHSKEEIDYLGGEVFSV